MLRRLLIAILIALPFSVFAQKFAIIDTQSLMESMPELKTANEQLEAANKKYAEEFKMLQEEFRKKYEEFQALDPSTLQTIKDRRMQEMQELDNKIQQFQATASQDLQRQQQQLMAPIQEKVMQAVQAVGAEGSYTFVFEKGQAIYTGSDVADITAAVKSRLGIQ